jgi:hypothetical protein
MTKPAILTSVLIAIWIAAALNSKSQTQNSSPHRALSYSTRALLRRSDKFILLSIDPFTAEQVETEKRELFHDHRVLGKTEVKDGKQEWDLITALITGVERARDRKFAASCFNPRHAIHAVAGTNSVDLLICFECGRVAEYTAAGLSFSEMEDDAKELVNRTLTEAGVPLAKQ